jgi:PncC family amidohydrolase
MTIGEAAKQLVERLAERQMRVVFAESCTGGLISAELAKIPGVSDWLCGSAVTYRCDTKVQWLGVKAEDIQRHTAVSKEVAMQMARGALMRTPEASVAASITGHLGPDAPEDFDGLVFIGTAMRNPAGAANVEVSRHPLAEAQRLPRQIEAASLVLRLLLAKLG